MKFFSIFILVISSGVLQANVLDQAHFKIHGYKSHIKNSENLVTLEIKSSGELTQLGFDTLGDARIEIKFERKVLKLKSETAQFKSDQIVLEGKCNVELISDTSHMRLFTLKSKPPEDQILIDLKEAKVKSSQALFKGKDNTLLAQSIVVDLTKRELTFIDHIFDPKKKTKIPKLTLLNY